MHIWGSRYLYKIVSDTEVEPVHHKVAIGAKFKRQHVDKNVTPGP